MKNQLWLQFVHRNKGVQWILLLGKTKEEKLAYAKNYLDARRVDGLVVGAPRIVRQSGTTLMEL